jgi:hypothetical protein
MRKYIVTIKTGTGKNFAQMDSIPLESLDKVKSWVQHNPMGN